MLLLSCVTRFRHRGPVRCTLQQGCWARLGGAYRCAGRHSVQQRVGPAHALNCLVRRSPAAEAQGRTEDMTVCR